MNRNKSWTSGTAALALLAALGACSSDEPRDEGAAPQQTSTSTSSSPTSGCEEVAHDRATLAPGCWAIQVDGAVGLPLAELELPAGFTGSDAWVWVPGGRQDEWGAITLATTGGVYSDPCRRIGGTSEAHRTIADFAAALAGQPGTTATKPTRVSVGGHDGLYLEVAVPPAHDVAGCPGKTLLFWNATEGAAPPVEPGMVSRLWILEVDGHHLVLAAFTNADARDRAVDLFKGIAASATFTES